MSRRPSKALRAALLVTSTGCCSARSGAPLPSPRAPESTATTSAATEIEVVSPALRGFFGKRVRDGALPILAHASVSDEALLAARDHLRTALEHAPKLRRNLESEGFELHVQGLRQFASDLPEYREHRGEKLHNGELFDWHMIGGHIAGSFLTCTEGTLLPIVGHRLFGDDTCFHELGHIIEWHGVDGPTRAGIVAAYQRSVDAGHWKGKYAATNPAEWFAEMTKLYFRRGTNALAFYDPSSARGRAWLQGEDPEAFRFVDELYGGRTDPGTLKTVLVALAPGRDELAAKSKVSRVPSFLSVRNATSSEIRLIWIDFDGKRDARQPFEQALRAAPGGVLEEYTWATHAFVVTDAAGRALCVLTAPEDNGAAEVKGPCE